MELQIQNEKMDIKKSITNTRKTMILEKDYILPDNKPDIIKVQTQNANIYVSKKENMENKIKIEGGIDLRVTYLTDEGKNRVLKVEDTFTEILEVNGVTESTYINEKMEISSINVSILNERKIHLKIENTCHIKVSQKESIEFIHEINPVHQLQTLNRKKKIYSYVGHGECKINLKEKMEIENLQEKIEIMKLEPTITNIEKKMSYNKVLVKADCNLKCLYITEAGMIYITKKEVPIMGFLDIENVEDTNECDISFSMKNLIIEENEKDINVEIEFNTFGDVYQSKEINIVEDLYCLNHKTNFTKQKVIVENNKKEIITSQKVKQKIIIEDINQLYDSSYRILNAETKGNYVEGKIEANFIFSTFENPGINKKEEIINFEISSEKQIENSELKIINSKSLILPDSSIETEIEIEIADINNEKNEIELINEIKIADEDIDDGYSMIVYIVKKGDSLWKIAKRFNSTVDEIVNLNEIKNEEKINIGDKLYIPRAI